MSFLSEGIVLRFNRQFTLYKLILGLRKTSCHFGQQDILKCSASVVQSLCYLFLLYVPSEKALLAGWWRAHMVEMLPAKLECKEIDTNLNLCPERVSTDSVFPKRRCHVFFKVRICFSCRREQQTSYSDDKHLKMTNKHLRSALNHHEYRTQD